MVSRDGLQTYGFAPVHLTCGSLLCPTRASTQEGVQKRRNTSRKHVEGHCAQAFARRALDGLSSPKPACRLNMGRRLSTRLQGAQCGFAGGMIRAAVCAGIVVLGCALVHDTSTCQSRRGDRGNRGDRGMNATRRPISSVHSHHPIKIIIRAPGS